MNVLILGGGGREHTFCWKLAQSPLCKKIYTAPGNAGTEQLSMNLPLDPMDFKAVKQAVLEYQIQMVVVGPEKYFSRSFLGVSFKAIFVILFFVILNNIPFSLSSFLKVSSSFTLRP